jgi:hypothetical protein
MGEIINQKLEEKLKQNQNKTNPIIEVTNETTLHAARRLVEDEGYKKAVCLNFASVKLQL